MKTKKLSYALFTLVFVFVCALIGFTATACKPDAAPVEGPESGVYYYDSPEGEYIISLNSADKFAFMVMGDNKSGTYALEGETLTLTLNGEESAFATATLKDGVITLTYNSTEMRFIKKVPFTVTFNSKGGNAVESVTVINGKTVSKPADPVRAGYAFLGWYSDENLTQPFAFGAEVITADTTLFAKWGKTQIGQSEFTVSFDLNYEGAEKQASVKTLGGKLYSVATPVRSGYTFGGWWISNSNKANELTYEYTADTVFEENTTLFALWANADLGSKLPSPAVNVFADSIKWNVVTGASSYRLQITGPEGFNPVEKTTNTPSEVPEFTVAGDYTVTVTALASAEANNSDPAVRVYRHKALKRVSLFEVAEPSVLLFNAIENAENYFITVECGNPNHIHTELANGSSTNYNFANCTMQQGGIKFTVRATAAGYADSVSEQFICDRTLNKIEEVTFDSETQTVLWNSVPNASRYTVAVKCKNTAHDHEYVFNAGNSTKLCLKQLAPCESGFEVSVVPVTNGYNSPEATTGEFTKTSLATPTEILVNGMTVSWNDVGATSYEVLVSGQRFTSTGTSIDLSTAKDVNGNGVQWTVSKYYTLSVRAAGDNGSLWSDTQDIRHLAMFATLSYTNGILSWGHVMGATSYEVQLNDGESFIVDGGKNFTEIELDKAGVNELFVRFIDPAETSDEWVSTQAFAFTVTFDSRGGTGVSTVLYRAAGDKTNFPEPERTGHDFAGWYNVPGGAEANGAEYTDEIFAESRDLYLYAYYIPKEFEVSLKLRTAEDDVYSVVKVRYGRAFNFPVPRLSGEDADDLEFGGWYPAADGAGDQLTDSEGKSVRLWPYAQDTVVYAFWRSHDLEFADTVVDGISGVEVFKSERRINKTVITIPETYMGKPVIKVADQAFGDETYCSEITEINIPNTVLLISSVTPFRGCTSLEKVNVYNVEGNNRIRYASDDGVLLDYGTIDNRTALADMIYVPQSKRGAYVVSDKVKTIVSEVFKDSKITSINIPTSVERIGNGAFSGSSLREITFRDETAATPTLLIDERAFLNCSNLTAISLPARLDSILLDRYTNNRYGEGVTTSLDLKEVTDTFYGCTSLTEITVAAGNKNYSSQDGVLYNANKSSLLYFPAAKSGEFEIPSGVATVSAGAFFECSRITAVTIPGSVTSVDECAFYRCSALEKVSFGGIRGSRGTTIGRFAFRECDKLAELTFADDVNITTIGERAFYGCAALTEVELPRTLTSVGNEAFRNCNGLTKLVFGEENEDKITESQLKLTLGDDIYSDCRRLSEVYLSKYVINIPVFSGCAMLNDLTVSKGHPTFAGLGKEPIINTEGVLLSYPLMGDPVYKIPDNVVKIAASAFKSRNVTKVIISKGVTEIGADAFADCYKLEEVEFEEGGTENLIIADGAFRSCYSLSAIKIPARTTKLGSNAFAMTYLDSSGNTMTYATGIESVEFEDGINLEEIGAGAFMGAHIKRVAIPASVKVIGDSAFFATSLEYVDFAENTALETIGGGAFAGQMGSSHARTSQLKQITIPNTVTAIRPSAFAYCVNLKTITFQSGGDKELAIGDPFRASNDGDHSRGNVFFACTSLEEINLPARTVRIGYYTFGSCEALKKVTFAEEGAVSKLQFIDESAFTNSGLTSIVIPKSVSNQEVQTLRLGGVDTPYNRPAIGAEAFSYCMALESVVFEDGGSGSVTIGAGAFEGMIKSTVLVDGRYKEEITYIALKSIVLPATLDTYENGAKEILSAVPGGLFCDCYYLESITVLGENKFYASDDGVLYTADYTKIVVCPLGKTGELDLHENLTELNSETFYGCSKITSIVIPGSITGINNTMLVRLTGLREIKVKGDNTLYKTVNGALYSADGTTLISVPINYGDNFEVPEGVTEIGESAFRGCKISEISLPASLEAIGANSFRDCRQLDSLTFADGCKLAVIPEFAFVNCTSLKTIRIPAAVTEIVSKSDPDNFYSSEYSPFNGCTSLKTITFEQGSQLSKIGDACFMNLGALETVVLPESLTVIGAKAFMYCEALTTINIPAGVLELPENLFYNCTNLSSVTFAENSELNKIGANAFYLCEKLSSITIPAEVTEICKEAFAACYALTNIEFAGNNITTIGEAAFSSCHAITSFVLPESVTIINDNLFRGCDALESITLHDKLTAIGGYAFNGCSSLTGISIPDSLTSLGEGSFMNSGLTSFTLPKKVTSVSRNLLEGCVNLTQVTLHDSVTEIGAMAFYNTGLTSFEIPAMVTGIGDRAFSNTNITEFTVSTANSAYKSDNGIIFSSDGKTLISVPAGMTGSYTIGRNITVAPYAFTGSNISEITISSGVKISESAFYASAVRKLNINAAVTIGRYAFQNCSLLEEIVVGRMSNLTIENYAFRYCYNLKEFTVNNSGINLVIGPEAFNGCTSFKSLNINAKSITINDSAFSSLGSLESVTLTAADNIVIGDEAFINHVNLKTLTIAAGGTVTIGKSAFDSTSYARTGEKIAALRAALGLTYEEFARKVGVNLQDAIDWEELSDATSPELDMICKAFNLVKSTFYASSLQTVEISGSEVVIGEQAFRYSNELTSLDLSAKTKVTLKTGAFSCCFALETVTVKATDAGSSIDLGSSSFTDCSSLKVFTLEASDIKIGYLALCRAGLESIKLSSNYSVSMDAFNGWKSTQTIYVTLSEQEVKLSSKWDQLWRDGCEAEVVFDCDAQ